MNGDNGIYDTYWFFQVVLVVKNLPANAGDAGDVGLIPGSGRSLAGRHCNPLQDPLKEGIATHGLMGDSPWGLH